MHRGASCIAALPVSLLPGSCGSCPDRSILVGPCRCTFAAVQLERDKRSQQQLSEVRGVIARYRGPLLESAIDLEQRMWHLVRLRGCLQPAAACWRWDDALGLHMRAVSA